MLEAGGGIRCARADPFGGKASRLSPQVQLHIPHPRPQSRPQILVVDGEMLRPQKDAAAATCELLKADETRMRKAAQASWRKGTSSTSAWKEPAAQIRKAHAGAAAARVQGDLPQSRGVCRRSKTAWVDLAELPHQPPSPTEPASSTAACSAALHKAPWLKHGCTFKFQILDHGNHSVALKNLQNERCNLV